MYNEYNLRRLMQIFFRQKLKFLLVFSLFAAGGLLYIDRMAPVYEARGSLLVKFGQGARPDITMPGHQPAELSYSDRREIMQSNVRILQSRNLLKDIISGTGIDRLYPGLTDEAGKRAALESAIDRLLNEDLEVRAVGQSNIIEIAVRNHNPENAALFAQQLMDEFARRQAELYQTPQAVSFLEQQAADQKRELAQSRQAFSAFKDETGISDIDQEIAQLMQEKSSLTDTAFEAVNEAQIKLAQLEAQAAEMRTTYNADSPLLKRLLHSISVAKDQLHERQAGLNPAGGEGRALGGRIAWINERIGFLESRRARYNELQQRVAIDQESYRLYQLRAEEQRVVDLLNSQNITRISVVDRPVIPARPVPPRKSLILLAFLMAGGLAGFSVALGAELTDERVTSPDQIASQLGLPVLVDFAKVKGV